MYGESHPDLASTLNALAGVEMELGNFDRSADLYQRSLEIKERVLGPHHPELAVSLNDLAVLHARLDRYELAAPLYERALRIRVNVRVAATGAPVIHA